MQINPVFINQAIEKKSPTSVTAPPTRKSTSGNRESWSCFISIYSRRSGIRSKHSAMMPAAETLVPTETPSFLSAQKIDRVRLSHTIKAHNARYLGARRHALSERQKFDRSGGESVSLHGGRRQRQIGGLSHPTVDPRAAI